MNKDNVLRFKNAHQSNYLLHKCRSLCETDRTGLASEKQRRFCLIELPYAIIHHPDIVIDDIVKVTWQINNTVPNEDDQTVLFLSADMYPIWVAGSWSGYRQGNFERQLETNLKPIIERNHCIWKHITSACQVRRWLDQHRKTEDEIGALWSALTIRIAELSRRGNSNQLLGEVLALDDAKTLIDKFMPYGK